MAKMIKIIMMPQRKAPIHNYKNSVIYVTEGRLRNRGS